MKVCSACNIRICCHCAYRLSEKLAEDKIHRKFLNEVQRLAFSNRSTIPREINAESIVGLLSKEKHYFRRKINKHFELIKAKDIHRLVEECDEEFLKHYFLLVRFKGLSTDIRCLEWKDDLKEIRECFPTDEAFQRLKSPSTSQYDFLVFFSSEAHTITTSDFALLEEKEYVLLNKSANFSGVQAFVYCELGEKKATINFIMKLVPEELNFEWLDVEAQLVNRKKQFSYKSIREARGPDPELKILKKNFVMQNAGLMSTHISEYFRDCSYRQEIRHLDLTNNKLHDISAILGLTRLETLCLSKNFIREVII